MGVSAGPPRLLGAVYVLFAIAAGARSACVGLLTLADPGAFPDETVWSSFGQGYGFLPLVLPLAALAWLRASRAPTH